MANEMDRIVPLDDLEDFEVAEGEPDVPGWEVLASDGDRSVRWISCWSIPTR